MPEQIKGRCLCGAVQLTATPVRQAVVACHCDMCRRWTSSMYMAMQMEPDFEVTGPATTFVSSDTAERAFCRTCGSNLWFKITEDGPMHGQVQMAAGLFENAGDAALKLELNIERKPDGYAFEGQRRQLTRAEEMAMRAPQTSGGAS